MLPAAIITAVLWFTTGFLLHPLTPNLAPECILKLAHTENSNVWVNYVSTLLNPQGVSTIQAQPRPTITIVPPTKTIKLPPDTTKSLLERPSQYGEGAFGVSDRLPLVLFVAVLVASLLFATAYLQYLHDKVRTASTDTTWMYPPQTDGQDTAKLMRYLEFSKQQSEARWKGINKLRRQLHARARIVSARDQKIANLQETLHGKDNILERLVKQISDQEKVLQWLRRNEHSYPASVKPRGRSSSSPPRFDEALAKDHAPSSQSTLPNGFPDNDEIVGDARTMSNSGPEISQAVDAVTPSETPYLVPVVDEPTTLTKNTLDAAAHQDDDGSDDDDESETNQPSKGMQNGSVKKRRRKRGRGKRKNQKLREAREANAAEEPARIMTNSPLNADVPAFVPQMQVPGGMMASRHASPTRPGGFPAFASQMQVPGGMMASRHAFPTGTGGVPTGPRSSNVQFAPWAQNRWN